MFKKNATIIFKYTTYILNPLFTFIVKKKK